MTGGVAGLFCSVSARHYHRLMVLGYRPDAASLMAALRATLTAPVTPIIGVDDAGWSRLLHLMAAAVASAVLTGLYMRHGGSATFLTLSFACIVLILLACIDVRACLLPDAL